MHPAFIHWWKSERARLSNCATWAHCGPGESGGGGRHGHDHRGQGPESRGRHEMHAAADCGDGGGFGVRRPLRFMAYKLDLNEQQVASLAKIIDDLKTERAQAEVDSRRTLSGFADAVSGEVFDVEKAKAAAQARVDSAEKLRVAVLAALQQIHGLLTVDQRSRFAYLIRTGTLTL